MGYSYRHVEEEYDRNKRNQDKIRKLGDEINELKTTIIGLTEEKNQTGFTDEQCFFISYYDLDKEKCKNTKFNMIGLGILLGGIVGNLLDRVLFGYVRDFLDIYIFKYNFPIFNIADICIVLGVIMLIISILRGEDKSGNSSK